MTSIPFDAHDAVKTLRNAGVGERTAEAMVQVMPRTTDLPKVEHLATKEFVEAALAKQERRLIWWVIGTGVVSTFGKVVLDLISAAP